MHRIAWKASSNVPEAFVRGMCTHCGVRYMVLPGFNEQGSMQSVFQRLRCAQECTDTVEGGSYVVFPGFNGKRLQRVFQRL